VTSLRFWIVVLALSCFGAGLAGGWLAAARLHPPPSAAGPFEEYQRQFAAQFELSPERTRLLGDVLADYAQKIDELEQEHLDRSMSELEADLQQLGLTYSGRIRDHVLPPDRRADYDALAAGVPWNPKH
jgi:hypothetical protein